ncbi:hypothetical protein B7494_g1865 [Chlorociboria aeruginascens]|nr:hypothetical protein B7494_g1865 [Chlorociboria aeruginascens]
MIPIGLHTANYPSLNGEACESSLHDVYCLLIPLYGCANTKALHLFFGSFLSFLPPQKKIILEAGYHSIISSPGYLYGCGDINTSVIGTRFVGEIPIVEVSSSISSRIRTLSQYTEILQTNSSSFSLPFLPNSEKTIDSECEPTTISKPDRRQRWLIIHSIIFIAYSLAFFMTNSWMRNTEQKIDLAYINGALKYEKVLYDGRLETINPYRGDPRPELDQAWRDLLQNNNIRISKDELKKMNRSSIELQVLHSDYYPEVNRPERDTHVDHCIDDIRQALMCNPDTSVVTFDWIPNYRQPSPNFAIDHTCANWEMLDSWAAARSFSAYDQKSLVHPQLGLAFPMVNGSIEEIASGPEMHITWPDEGHLDR